VTVLFKPTFLKDLARLPGAYQKRIEKLVFKDIAEIDDIAEKLDIKKMQGHHGYYLPVEPVPGVPLKTSRLK